MTTAYPGGIDNFTNPTSTDTLSSATVPHASEHANANDAIKAIETELGTNPKGSYASVSARLAASTGSITTWRKAAAGGETSLSGTDDFSTTLAYTVGQEQVFINGVLLERGVDYTATTGSSITGLTALVASDIAIIISVGSFNVANAIPLSTVTTKGDLIAATGASTVANVGVGADGTTLVADSSTSTGLRWQGSQAAGKNFVINGGMDWWQRGITYTQATNSGSGYGSADRWKVASYGSGSPALTLAQSTTVPSSVPVQYSAAMSWSSTVSTGDIFIEQWVENGKYLIAGQTVTLSFYAKATTGASFTFDLDQDYGGTVVAIGTAFQKYSISWTVPSTFQSSPPTGTSSGNNVEIRFFRSTSNNAVANTITFTGAQLEIGSVATPFSRAGGTLQGELAACQRYYYRVGGDQTTQPYGIGFGTAATTTSIVMTHPVTMRTAPTLSEYSYLWLADAGSTTNVTSLAIQANWCGKNTVMVVASVASGLTTYRPYILIAQGTTASYIGFSAEL